jgi:hypothetical protein
MTKTPDCHHYTHRNLGGSGQDDCKLEEVRGKRKAHRIEVIAVDELNVPWKKLAYSNNAS